MSAPLGLTIMDLGLIALILLFAYYLAFLLLNIYINLNIKNASLLFLWGVMLGMTGGFLIVGDSVYILLMLVLSIVFGLFTIIHGIKSKKQSKNIPAQYNRH